MLIKKHNTKIRWRGLIGFSILYDMIQPEEGHVISEKGIWILSNFTRKEIEQHTEKGGYINIEALESLYKQKQDNNKNYEKNTI